MNFLSSSLNLMASETEIMIFRVCLAQFGFTSEAVFFLFCNTTKTKVVGQRLLSIRHSRGEVLTKPAAVVF